MAPDLHDSPPAAATPYADARRDVINGLAWLDPLVRLRESLVAAEDADGRVAAAESELAGLRERIEDDEQVLAAMDTRVSEARARADEQVAAIEAVVAEKRTATNTRHAQFVAGLEAERTEAETLLAQTKAGTRVELDRLNAELAAKRTEITRAEARLAELEAARAEFQRLAGAGR